MRNIILFVFILFVVLISSFYATFSLVTTSEGVSVVDGIKTLNFVLGNDSEDNSVMIAGKSHKNIAVTISNKDTLKLKYGIYYSSFDDLSDVNLGYRHSTEYLPNGMINSNEDYIVTLEIENNSDDVKTISFGVVFGLENGGELVLEENQHFLDQMWNFPLTEVPKGSYVKFVGNNGCVEGQCDGINANFVDSQHIGYCGDEKTSFHDSGWRVAYSRRGSAYLISAGAVECITQDDDFSKVVDERVSSYCNIDYAYRGICDSNSVWSMNSLDFYNILGSKLNEESCLEQEKSSSCGYENDLLDIGSFYWLSSEINQQFLYYQPNFRYFSITKSDVDKGLRPVLKLADTVIVEKGSGTKSDPYQIKNTVVPNFDYTIVYNGNGASDGDTESSVHQTNKLQKLNKNGFTLTYQLDLSTVANFDDSYCDEDGVCYRAKAMDLKTKEAQFLGWSTDASDREAMFKDEEEVVNLSVSSSDIIVNLYAIWDLDTFKLPEIQSRDGYEILGWYTLPEGGEKVGNPGDEYHGDEKNTLYARWQKKDL